MESIIIAKKKLRIWTIGTIIFLFISLIAIFLFYLNLEVHSPINQVEFEQAIKQEEKLREYYASQEGFEAHFINAANIIQDRTTSSHLQYFVFYFFPILLVGFLLSNLLAKRVLDPIKDVFDSKQRFMEDVAHELRNPLSAIKSSTQSMILDDNNVTEENKQTLKVILRQVDNLIDLSNDLITLEKDHEDEIKHIPIREVLEDIKEQLKAQASQKNVEIEVSCDHDIALGASVNDISTLFRNLISNSIKYSKPAGGTVKIEVGKDKTKIAVTLKDNGIGIRREDLKYIGNRFYRTSDAKGKQGSGLGLSIVKKIITKYRGKFTITSEYGNGVEIYFTLHSLM